MYFSGQHKQHHDVLDITEKNHKQQRLLRRDLKELEEYIHPNYQESASYLLDQKVSLKKEFQKLGIDLREQGKIWHREIDNLIEDLQYEVNEMETRNKRENRT